jgi:tRNA modification GTPase
MILNHDDEPIIAQCTPCGSGALALLRLSGIGTINIASTMSKLASGQLLTQLPSHTIHYGSVVNNAGTVIDQVMFLLMKGPKTFTGQDVVEITCHNNPFIIQEILECAIQNGARLAQNGEFTRRALVNGKIDLLQAEAINELIHANTQLALKKSLAQLQGSFSSWLEDIQKELFRALALCQASFEFIDEEMGFAPHILTIINQLLTCIIQIKKTFDQQQHIKNGVRIALIGSVNTGKSSLFNALLGKNRAIVTNIAGTTRDVIEAGIYKNGNYWTLIDTAGLRTTNDIIEQEGIIRSLEQAHQADIILLVYDCTQKLSAQEQDVYQSLNEKYASKIIRVYNKVDEYSGPFNFDLAVSAQKHTNIDILHSTIEKKIETILSTIDSPFLLNQRQFNNLYKLELLLQEIKKMVEVSPQYELLCIHFNDAIALISELSGKTISEQGMDVIFREFCVGK